MSWIDDETRVSSNRREHDARERVKDEWQFWKDRIWEVAKVSNPEDPIVVTGISILAAILAAASLREQEGD